MGKIILYDDEPIIVRQLKQGIRKVELTPIEFTEIIQLRKYIYANENWNDVEALIFDLAQAMEASEGTHQFEILADIEHCYKQRRIPILIHSAFAEQVEKLRGLPTVFLYKKGQNTIRKIRSDLDLMKKTGFLGLYSEGPILKDEAKRISQIIQVDQEEIKIMLHSKFREMFKGVDLIKELEKILIENEDMERKTYLKFLKPVVDKFLE